MVETGYLLVPSHFELVIDTFFFPWQYVEKEGTSLRTALFEEFSCVKLWNKTWLVDVVTLVGMRIA